MSTPDFKPALIVVDMQEDFCPPNGSLAVPDGRAIIPTINTLLAYPFALRIATKDWHPPNHISFASSHPPARPFVDFTAITNPLNPSERYESRLWPDHCIQGTPGAALLPALDLTRIDRVIEKGTHPGVEMYSAFYAPLRNPRVGDSGLASLLRGEGVTHVYVVGLAADYCVSATAEDAKREGFATVIVEEATRPVDGARWERMRGELEGVRVVKMDGAEVERVRRLA